QNHARRGGILQRVHDPLTTVACTPHAHSGVGLELRSRSTTDVGAFLRRWIGAIPEPDLSLCLVVRHNEMRSSVVEVPCNSLQSRSRRGPERRAVERIAKEPAIGDPENA